MVFMFFMENSDYFSAEIRNIKTQRATREAYADEAIGFVQVKRIGSVCTVKAKLTPEFRLGQKDYNVEAQIEENEERIVSCRFLDCKGSAGGCKHAVAFIMWLHRLSEEPSVTSAECYWKKSSLSVLGKNANHMKLEDIVGDNVTIPPVQSGVSNIIPNVIDMQGTGGVFAFYSDYKFANLGLYQLSLKYKNLVSLEDRNVDDFLEFIKYEMGQGSCEEAEAATRQQSQSHDWFELRFARITASKVFEASRSHTYDGVLTEAIMGASKPLETEPIKRGLRLEQAVLDVIAERHGMKIKKCGIFLDTKYPIFGASPDGLMPDCCVEVKCPANEKTMKNYVSSNGVVNAKYEAQVQLQMLFTGNYNL